MHRPVETPVPPPPSGDWMAEEEWSLLWKLIDAVLPSITTEAAATDSFNQLIITEDELEKAIDRTCAALTSPPRREEIRDYLAQRPSISDEFRNDVRTMLSTSPQRDQFAGALKFLGTRAGSLMLTWLWTPLDQQPLSVREAMLKSWASGKVEGMRVLSKSLATVAQKANAVTNKQFLRLSGYNDVPQDWKPVDGHNFEFVQIEAGESTHTIETEVIIIGSGPGGGVSAKNITEAGHKVLVVDKGYYFPPSQLPMTQTAGTSFLFDNRGVQTTDNGALTTLNAATWGGGGTVNWSVCLDPPAIVRKEWADGGLPMFQSPEFDACLDRVNQLVGKGSEKIRHNYVNRVNLESHEKLGWKAQVAPQNTAGMEHYCGQCHLGCGSAEKRGPAISMLPAASDAGAEFMEGFHVERIVFADDGETAVGVEGVWTSRGPNGSVHSPVSERVQRKVLVKAKRVVVSGGSVWSPVILKNSGIENENVGKHLHLHPCNVVTAVFPEETRPWEGGIITSYGTEFDNLDGKGHGVTLEPLCGLPYPILAQQPWNNALDSKLMQLKYRHTIGFIALTRDRDSGQIYPDEVTGKPRLKYTPSDFDRESALEGVQALAKLCYVAGASEIRPQMNGVPPFIMEKSPLEDTGKTTKDPEFKDPRFAAWLLNLRQVGNAPPTAVWTSAHQMGSCRMAASPEDGVVDEKGRVWGRKGLYVADSSVLPSASGVNPMITNLAISDWISRAIVDDLKG